MHTAGSHLHARETDTAQARLRRQCRPARNVTSTAFQAALTAATGRTTTVDDAAKRLGIKPATVRRYARAGKLAAVRDERGRVVGIAESSISSYRKARAAERRKFASCRFRTTAAYATAA